MKAVELINSAYVLAGIVARDLEQVQGSEGQDGLFWLNMLLSEKSMAGNHLPYYGHLEFTGIPGQETYFVRGLITADAVTFNIGTVRYFLRPSPRRMYFGEARVDNINSLPYHYFAERVNNGMNIFFYFSPSQAFVFKVTGLIALSQVGNDDELNNTLDEFYQLLLLFELAEMLAIWKKISLPPATKSKLDEYRSKLFDMNPRDFTLKIRPIVSSSGGITYGDINFGRGWRP